MTGEAYFAGLSLGALAYALVAVFVAAFVRGYSGFGLSALIVTSLAIVIPPAEIVPMAILLEVAASLGVMRQIWRDVAWRETGVLMAGACLGTPLGITLLIALPADTMRAIIALTVLAASIGLWFGLRFRGLECRPALLGTGVVSGMAQGAAAVGGLPLVLYFLSVSSPPAVIRATLITYLLIISIYSLAVALWHDLVTFEVLLRTALLTLPLVFGIALGNHRFISTSPTSFRHFALGLLMVLSVLGLMRALFG